MQNGVPSIRNTSLFGFQPFPVVFGCKTATLGLELQVSVGSIPHLWFLHAKQRLMYQNNKSLWVPDMTCRLCMYNSVISVRITCLYVSQLSSVVFACKAATFGPELKVSMCTRPHLSFCSRKTAWLAPEVLVSMGSSPPLWLCAFKTATLGPKLHVSMGPTTHLCFSACKTAYLALVSMGPSPHL